MSCPGRARDITLALLLACILAAACGPDAVETVVSGEPTILSTEGLTLRPPRPLTRTRRSADIRLAIPEAWRTTAPFDGRILLEDSREVHLRVFVKTGNGNLLAAKVYGSASGRLHQLVARFDPEIPEGEQVVEVSIRASAPLTAERISWYDWNPG